jgi:hypothetical protein
MLLPNPASHQVTRYRENKHKGNHYRDNSKSLRSSKPGFSSWRGLQHRSLIVQPGVQLRLVGVNAAPFLVQMPVDRKALLGFPPVKRADVSL